MHRAVGQLLLDRIDLAVKPIPELSAHLQGMPIRIDFLSIERIASAVNVLQMLIANNVIRITKFSFVFFIFAPILVSLRLVYISVCRWWRTGWLSLHREAFYLSAPAPCPL